MTVGKLVDFLLTVDRKRTVVMQSDPEGNSFAELDGISEGRYNKERQEPQDDDVKRRGTVAAIFLIPE